jgi:protoporphyrin/coproporphyrin ferrochelatase
VFVQEANVSDYSVAFQSRLGKEPWLKPYSDKLIEELARKGVKKLLVICPSFVCDCLEMNERPLIDSTKEKILCLSAETQFAPNGIVSRTLPTCSSSAGSVPS